MICNAYKGVCVPKEGFVLVGARMKEESVPLRSPEQAEEWLAETIRENESFGVEIDRRKSAVVPE